MLNFDYQNTTRYVFGPGEHRNLGTLLKVLIALLTALAGALGLSACGRW